MNSLGRTTVPVDRPEFVSADATWEATTRRYNGFPITLYRTAADSRTITGWTQNPRIEMILRRWRNAGRRSDDAFPDDEEMLELMLEDDEINRNRQSRTFAIIELGEDIKRNGIREPIIVTWDGLLLDGNRRKFAVMWALSSRGSASREQQRLLERIPMFVLPIGTSQNNLQSILIEENYAPSLKYEWPQVVTNGALYRRYQELLDEFTDENDLDIRRRLHTEFPRFGVTDIRNRIETWQLTEEFRGEYGDELGEDTLERMINNQFQYFRQAIDTFRRKNVFQDPEFRDLLFKGIRHELFPSFTSVRTLEDIHASPTATEVFLQGEGLESSQRRTNFRRARDEAGRERAERDLTLERRIQSVIDQLDNLTSKELAAISLDLRARLEGALERIVAQASVSETTD